MRPASAWLCAPFLWQQGVMAPLPTLGGNNGTASQINRWGMAAGEAENTTLDPDCPHKRQFKPVKWVNGAIHELPTYPGDPDAVAYAINDKGQVVGSSGTCATPNPALQPPRHPCIRSSGNPMAPRSTLRARHRLRFRESRHKPEQPRSRCRHDRSAG